MCGVLLVFCGCGSHVGVLRSGDLIGYVMFRLSSALLLVIVVVGVCCFLVARCNCSVIHWLCLFVLLLRSSVAILFVPL